MVEYEASPIPTSARQNINTQKLRAKDPNNVDRDHTLSPNTRIHFRL